MTTYVATNSDPSLGHGMAHLMDQLVWNFEVWRTSVLSISMIKNKIANANSMSGNLIWKMLEIWYFAPSQRHLLYEDMKGEMKHFSHPTNSGNDFSGIHSHVSFYITFWSNLP